MLLTVPIHLGTISGNCYLLRSDEGFVLIDTGLKYSRRALEVALASAGCTPGTLNRILLTHGDFDHTGNADYLRAKYGATISMHEGDRGMVERGDMFHNRTTGNALARMLVNALFRIRTFSPDELLEEGQSLSPYGLDATVLHLPGHSQGSIGVLTRAGDLFCGDLLANTRTPEMGPLIDNPEQANASIQRLKGIGLRTIYPGHGKPFAAESLQVWP